MQQKPLFQGRQGSAGLGNAEQNWQHTKCTHAMSTGRLTRVRAVLGVVNVLDLQAEQRIRQPALLRRIAGAPQGFLINKTLLCA